MFRLFVEKGELWGPAEELGFKNGETAHVAKKKRKSSKATGEQRRKARTSGGGARRSFGPALSHQGGGKLKQRETETRVGRPKSNPYRRRNPHAQQRGNLETSERGRHLDHGKPPPMRDNRVAKRDDQGEGEALSLPLQTTV